MPVVPAPSASSQERTGRLVDHDVINWVVSGRAAFGSPTQLAVITCRLRRPTTVQRTLVHRLDCFYDAPRGISDDRRPRCPGGCQNWKRLSASLFDRGGRSLARTRRTMEWSVDTAGVVTYDYNARLSFREKSASHAIVLHLYNGNVVIGSGAAYPTGAKLVMDDPVRLKAIQSPPCLQPPLSARAS